VKLPAEIAAELLSLPLFDIVTVATVDDDLPVDFDLDQSILPYI